MKTKRSWQIRCQENLFGVMTPWGYFVVSVGGLNISTDSAWWGFEFAWSYVETEPWVSPFRRRKCWTFRQITMERHLRRQAGF